MANRLITQVAATLMTNGYLKGFWEKTIYSGEAKRICVPGFNCYSCPGALGACPIGAIQAVENTTKYSFAFYVIGSIALLGIILGRFICGWLCPFALLQEALYKIPMPKLKIAPGPDMKLRYLKYFFLLVFVILLPIFLVDQFGLSSPFFCEYICPAGTLEGGIPLVLFNESLRGSLGLLFAWKFLILAVIILLSLMIFRPFCKYLCPLGAFYALLNKVSFYRYQFDESRCKTCNTCTNNCKMGINVHQNPNSPECIRCGECIRNCPAKAIKSTFPSPRGNQLFRPAPTDSQPR